MRNDTVGLAMCYFDRFLSAVPVDKAEVQLVAVACVLVAAKFGERRMPALADLEFVCQGKYNADDIRRAECDVIKKLNWQLHAVTPHMFCAHFLRAAVHQPARAAIVFRHAEFFVDLSFYGAQRGRAARTPRPRIRRSRARAAPARTAPRGRARSVRRARVLAVRRGRGRVALLAAADRPPAHRARPARRLLCARGD